ncbi:2-dehydro-3-deoxygluconokinase [Sphingobium sp. B11D3B]|uniref:sugar kinase n=1 Tax=Sphingobium sp. B11D3B TaxID=2940575 RepID=UPI0022274840|nr:sugar kinase [Sphingobium sp. B11D3B]MCW2389207.1 2-dehydro-3-deoxygluconokinase [Sphingobium sp. B11D3B]
MRVLAIGEGMVEFRREDACWRQAHGGDVVNTAIHLARFGIETEFATAIGRDDFSDFLAAQWQGEGLDLSCVARSPAHECGIYFIATDERGERSFTYRRSDSAARRLVPLIGKDRLAAAAQAAQLIYTSLVTLAILPDQDRSSLLDILQNCREAGGQVAFDSNYRPALWESPETARRWHEAALGVATIGLPTLEDEAALTGVDRCEDVAAHWRARGVTEVAVKMGAAGAMIAGAMVPPQVVVSRPLDTSGAGDAFNGAYLAHRLAGASAAEAAAAGNRLAGWVVQRRGAIPAAEAEPYGRTQPDRAGSIL